MSNHFKNPFLAPIANIRTVKEPIKDMKINQKAQLGIGFIKNVANNDMIIIITTINLARVILFMFVAGTRLELVASGL